MGKAIVLRLKNELFMVGTTIKLDVNKDKCCLEFHNCNVVSKQATIFSNLKKFKL